MPSELDRHSASIEIASGSWRDDVGTGSRVTTGEDVPVTVVVSVTVGSGENTRVGVSVSIFVGTTVAGLVAMGGDVGMNTAQARMLATTRDTINKRMYKPLSMAGPNLKDIL
jgi:hypothetical protein